MAMAWKELLHFFTDTMTGNAIAVTTAIVTAAGGVLRFASSRRQKANSLYIKQVWFGGDSEENWFTVDTDHASVEIDPQADWANVHGAIRLHATNQLKYHIMTADARVELAPPRPGLVNLGRRKFSWYEASIAEVAVAVEDGIYKQRVPIRAGETVELRIRFTARFPLAHLPRREVPISLTAKVVITDNLDRRHIVRAKVLRSGVMVWRS